MSPEALDPAEMLEFTGDLGQLERDVTALTGDGASIWESGAKVDSSFRGLSSYYEAPEAERLFAITAPVATGANEFCDELETVSQALGAYAIEVRPLVDKLNRLRAEAADFRTRIASEEEWHYDDKLTEENNSRRSEMHATWEAFQNAERTCSNKVFALFSDFRFVQDDGKGEKPDANEYGYSADMLNSAQDLPWGNTVDESVHWYEIHRQVKRFVWDGFIVDGVWGTIRGLGTLVGVDGGAAAGEAWTNLAKVVTGIVVIINPASALLPLAVGGDKAAKWMAESQTALKETGKMMISYDQWGKDNARAAGGATFNVLSTVLTGGVGAGLKGGAIARGLSAAAKVVNVVDPMTYVAKGARFGALKIGDAMATLRNLNSGTYLDIANGSYKIVDVPVKASELPPNSVLRPENSVRMTGSDGKVVYLNTETRLLHNADGTVIERPGGVKTEMSAEQRGAEPEKAVPQREPALVGSAARDGDIAPRVGQETPTGAAGRSGDAPFGPGHEAPVGRGEAPDASDSGRSGSDPGAGGGGVGGPPASGGGHLPDGPMEPRGNRPDGSWEGPQGLTLSREANAAAGQFLDRARATEANITDTVRSAASRVEHGKLNGLEYRLKDENSLKRKVATALLEDARLSPERALADIKDSLRYTVEIPAKGYAHGVQQAVDGFRARGFENVTFKNTWDSSGYKGINSTWRDPVSGQVFEVQFHTPDSFAAKMETHALYEKERLPGISGEERAGIRAAQSEQFARVQIPHGADSVRLDDGLPRAGSPDVPDVGLGRQGDESVHGNGPPAELTPEQRVVRDEHLNELAQRHNDDFEQLKQDPDHKGKIKPSEMDEARVALDLRENGKVPADIQRPPGANQGDLYSPGTGEFYDIKGVHSDWPPLNNVRDKSLPFKGAYDPANNARWERKLEDQIVTRERMVILDMRNANQAAIDDVKAIVERRGWSDRVVWYP